MKPNINRYYVGIVNHLYSLSFHQWREFKKIRDDENKNRWDEALEYIEENGQYEFELDGNYHFQ